MGLFKFKEEEIGWFLLIVVFSFIPVLIRLVVTADYDGADVVHLDIKDVLFSGLAVNISNIPLVVSRKMQYKEIMISITMFCIACIAVGIGVFLSNELNHVTNELTFLKYACFAVVLGSVLLSYKANRFIFVKPVKK